MLVVVPYMGDQTIKHLTTLYECAPEVNDVNFPTNRVGNDEIFVSYLRLPMLLDEMSILAEIRERGSRPLNAPEVLALGLVRTDDKPLLALGQPIVMGGIKRILVARKRSAFLTGLIGKREKGLEIPTTPV